MSKTLRFATFAAAMGLTLWLSDANAVTVKQSCDFKQGMPCAFIAPSQPCQWLDGQDGYCGCVNRDHYECVRI